MKNYLRSFFRSPVPTSDLRSHDFQGGRNLKSSSKGSLCDSSQDLFIPDCWRSFHYGVKALRLHPGRLTWNLQINHLERKLIFQTIHFQVIHVSFRGSILLALATQNSSSLTHYWIWIPLALQKLMELENDSSFASSSKKPIPNYIP